MTKGDVVVLAVAVQLRSRSYDQGTKVRVLAVRDDGLALVTTRLASGPTWKTTFAVEVSKLDGGRTGQPS